MGVTAFERLQCRRSQFHNILRPGVEQASQTECFGVERPKKRFNHDAWTICVYLCTFICYSWLLTTAQGDMDKIMPCIWTSDQEDIVMEVPVSILAFAVRQFNDTCYSASVFLYF